ncbi:MAG TPA: hypothetical protein VMU95_00520 [Trebonia sp.]|nr:hypothetical protein [Trebonia sp.]
MIKKALPRRAVAFGTALAAAALAAATVAPAASADTTRTLNLAFTCATGEPYGLSVDTYNGSAWSGWYYPSGSSYAVGTTKYFSVSISASAQILDFQPSYCDNEPTLPNANYMWEGDDYALPGGTAPIDATGSCNDYEYSAGFNENFLFYVCTLSSLTTG